MTIKQRFFIALQYILPHHRLSRWIGCLARCEQPWFKNALIRWFIKRYQVDMAQAENDNPLAYRHFNDFFTRALKPGARPIDEASNSIACPADGAISQIGAIRHGRIFQAKGHDFSLYELLGGDAERSRPFINGAFTTIYLSPRDYHRVHMPVTGTLKEMVYIPGKLFSVNQTTAENVPELFARNERVACLFDTEFGPMAVVLVGAMIVASIETVWAGEIAPVRPQVRTFDYSNSPHEPIVLNKGDELGRFKLGSTAIVLFGADTTTWLESLKDTTAVHMGQSLGNLNTLTETHTATQTAEQG